ncbi:unnamed protein product, partial [Allacma fusca]
CTFRIYAVCKYRSHMAELLSLCTDLVIQPDVGKPENPVLTDCLKGLQSHRILKNANDESLKSVVKLMNQLLNDPRTRAKGLMLFDSFLAQVDSSRFVALQDSFVSALQLLSKCLNLDLSHRILVNLLPVCNKVPEFSQAVAASIVPKLLSRFGDTARTKTQEEIESLVVCLERYRGPCMTYRGQLEKVVRPYIDCSREEEVFSVAKMFPLLSALGGGGTKGERYSQDWNQSVTNLLRVMYDALAELYGDACTYIDTKNPYEVEDSGTNFDLPNIRQVDVLLRISTLNCRLCNLATILSSYLSEPFPAPKPVPVRGILNIISNMMLVNPVSLLKKPEVATPKEIVYLAGLIPSVLSVAFQLLRSLIRCCKTQIFPEVTGIELQIVEQAKWLLEKPGSFENLRIELYQTLQSLLKVTHGCLASNKNASIFLQLIFQDVRVTKQSVSLSKINRKGKKAAKGQGITSIQNSSDPEVVEKNESVCTNALKVLHLLVPVLANADTRSTYLLLVTTTWDLLKSGDPPSPYKAPESRANIFSCLAQLVLTPNPKSPVSVGVIANLLQLGSKDSSHLVASTCEQLSSTLERIINPAGPTLQFPAINLPYQSISEPAVNGDVNENGLDSDVEDYVQVIPTGLQLQDSFCQTEDSELEVEEELLSRSVLDVSFIKETVSQALRENLEELGSIIKLHNGGQNLSSVANHSCNDDDERNEKSSYNSDNFFQESLDDDEAPRRSKRTRVSPTTTESHIVLAEEVHKELPFDKVAALNSSFHNGFSSSNEVEDSVNVSVEEMLLTFDDDVIASTETV